MNKQQNMFEVTGKLIPIPKNTFMRAVYAELENFKANLLDGNPSPVPNPFTESLVVADNGKTVMVPPDIQNEAIALYLQTDPELQSMVENSTTLSTRQPLIDTGTFNQNRLYEVDDDYEDVYVQSGINKTAVMLCLVALGLLIFFYRKKLKLV